MSSLTTITLNDGTLPVVFTPTSKKANLVTFHAPGATSIGRPKLKLDFSERSAGRRTDKVFINLSLPFEQTIDGEEVVKDTALFSGTFTIPEAFTSDERIRLMELAETSLADTFVQAYVKDLAPGY